MRTFVAALLFMGLVSSFPVGTFAQANHSPTGTWLIAMSRADRGLAHLTFSNNFTWTGYGISLESFGPLTIAGNWTNDNRGDVVGSYTETFPGAAIGWSMAAKLPGGKRFVGRAVSQFSNRLLRLTLRGAHAKASPNVSGDWVGNVRTHGGPFFEQYTITASVTQSNWFTVAGHGANLNGAFTVSGALIVNTDRWASGYTIRDFGSSVTTTSSFRGRFNAPLAKVVFVGRDDENRRVVIRAQKQ